uniref:Uncharacterized protein n=1 Tax=Tanacetum cinerariifolium TaxID=118510 RepID=A0A6L2M7V0_TANCI|nr:hypothetical protein [Tanacetum cinerariifolium]
MVEEKVCHWKWEVKIEALIQMRIISNIQIDIIQKRRVGLVWTIPRNTICQVIKWPLVGKDTSTLARMIPQIVIILEGEMCTSGNIVTNSRVTPSWKEFFSLTFSEVDVLHVNWITFGHRRLFHDEWVSETYLPESVEGVEPAEEVDGGDERVVTKRLSNSSYEEWLE